MAMARFTPRASHDGRIPAYPRRMTWGVVGVMVVAACGSPAAKALDAAVASDAAKAIDAPAGIDAPVGIDAAAAHLAVTPDHVDFAAVIIGCVSSTQTATFTNTGSTASGVLSTSLTGSDPGMFHITNDGCAGQDLAPAASCTVAVRFAPTSAGAKMAALVVTGSIVTVSVGLSGTSLAPGTTSALRTLTVIQAAGCPSTGTLAVSRAGIDPAQFAIATDTCSGATLAGGASCTLGVTYTAKASGTSSANLSVMANPGGTSTAGLQGE